MSTEATMEIGAAIPPGSEGSFSVGQRSQGTLADIPESHQMLLKGAITATLATQNASGTLQVSPVWVGSDDTHILLNSAKGRLKDKNMRARPNVSLLFMNPENPYHWMSVQGVVEEVIDESDPENGHLATENIDDAAELYVNQRPYPFRDPRGNEERVLYRVRPTRVQVFGSAG